MKENISLHIENLTCKTIIGILPEERLKPQKLIIEAHITYEYEDSPTFIDYAYICERITECLEYGAYELLETALIDIARALKVLFPSITHLNLCIKKPDILASCTVGASISRDL